MDHAGPRAYGDGSARALRLLIGVLLATLVAGCVTPTQRQTPELRREAGRAPRIVLMPLDVELSQLSAAGLEEPNSEWTEAALQHMRAALDVEAKARNVTLADFDPERGALTDREACMELVKLHRAVGGAALVHQYLPGNALPSKQGKFDWSLGPGVNAISRAYDADYALFLFVRDSYASAQRVAVMVVAALLGAVVPGGSQVGFASLVDLKSGDIVWFNRLAREQGDLRTPAAAAETVKALVSDSMR